MHKLASMALQQERDELISKQTHGVADSLSIWVITGVLELGLSMDLLKIIAAKYAKIGLVPIGYHHFELYKNYVDPQQQNKV